MPFDSTNKRFKINGKEKDDDSEVMWGGDEDDEIEFVGQRTRDEPDEVELAGKVAQKKDSEAKVHKVIAVDEPSYNDVLKHFRWENRSFKSVIIADNCSCVLVLT